jgi:hypothetical protein
VIASRPDVMFSDAYMQDFKPLQEKVIWRL